MTLEVRITPEIALHFATPVYIGVVEDHVGLNRALARLVLDWRDAGSGVAASNVGGWQSPSTLLERPEPEIGRLQQIIHQVIEQLAQVPGIVVGRQEVEPVGKYRAQGWANINHDGDYNHFHVHPGSHWAVVYYVEIGELAPGIPYNGRLELRDPRPAAAHGRVKGFAFGQSLAIDPRPGMVIGFPAWLEHGVHPFRGRGERISIAVNVDMIG